MEKEMKSEHRHELKTNELAEWLGNLPQWTKENLTTIACASVLIAVVAGLYIWKVYNKNVVQVRERTEFSNLLDQLSGGKRQIVQAQSQGEDRSFMLLEPAKKLGTFAQRTKNDRMAAMAFIKQAEALRAELHYGNAEKQYAISQTNQAKTSYAKAFEKCSADPSLAAGAKFGLGLCEEELGNFDQARQIYHDVTANPAFEGTVAVAQAKRRLETMADYEQEIVFKPSPKPVIRQQPAVQMKSTQDDFISGILDDVLRAPVVNPAQPVSVKSQSGEPNSVPKDSDANVPDK
jgi:tetratricopeptide (TPR) repeat protein